MACITTAIAIPTLFIPPAPPTPPSPSAAANSRNDRRPYLADLKLLLTNKYYLVLLFCFAIFVGIFNAMSTLLNQIVTPYGYSDDQAGYMGVAMILGGLIGAIAMAIFVDKTKLHKAALKTTLFLSGIMYLVLYFVGKRQKGIWNMPPCIRFNDMFNFLVKENNLTTIIAICALIGILNFSALPVGLELGVECK